MQQTAPINWLNTAFLTITPIGALTLVPLYQVTVGFNLYEWSIFFFYLFATGLSITGGYHRLWSHKTYKAHFLIRLFYAIFGAASCQNSILNWSSDHRSHHRFVDDPVKDPYAATKGFWYSHIGWVMRDYPRHVTEHANVHDLMRDPIVVWQHKYYLALAVVTNGVIPYLLGLAVGRPLGVLILAFFLRVVLNHHFTFFINSLAHIWGSRPYSEGSTARDNTFLSFFTYGEGYHNFHHTFQHDYRNGVRWWQFDPSKWLIHLGSHLGLTSHLKQASKVQIEKARMKMQLQRALLRAEKSTEAAKLREALHQSYDQCVTALNEWARVKKEWVDARRATMAEKFENVEMRQNYLEMKYALKSKRHQWRLLLAALSN